MPWNHTQGLPSRLRSTPVPWATSGTGRPFRALGRSLSLTGLSPVGDSIVPRGEPARSPRSEKGTVFCRTETAELKTVPLGMLLSHCIEKGTDSFRDRRIGGGQSPRAFLSGFRSEWDSVLASPIRKLGLHHGQRIVRLAAIGEGRRPIACAARTKNLDQDKVGRRHRSLVELGSDSHLSRSRRTQREGSPGWRRLSPMLYFLQ